LLYFTSLFSFLTFYYLQLILIILFCRCTRTCVCMLAHVCVWVCWGCAFLVCSSMSLWWSVLTDLQRIYTTFLYLLLDDACVFRCWFGLFRIGPCSLVCGSYCKESGMITNAVFNHLCSACHLTACFLINNINTFVAGYLNTQRH
jgi:hypothetical protein